MPSVATTDLPDADFRELSPNLDKNLEARWKDNINNGDYRLEVREKDAGQSWGDVLSTTISDEEFQHTIGNVEYEKTYEARLRTETEHSTGTWQTLTATNALTAKEIEILLGEGPDGTVAVNGPVEFECGSGGSVSILSSASSLGEVGVNYDGFAYWDDLYIDTATPMSLFIGPGYNTKATVQHLTGDPILHFDIISQQPNGTADIEVRNLQPEAWYRLQFDGSLAKTASGRAHGQTDKYGIIQWKGVNIPDE